MAEDGDVYPQKDSIALGGSSMPGAPSGVLSFPGMVSPQAPNPACCNDDAGSPPEAALPTLFGKTDMPAAPTESPSFMNDENVIVAVQHLSEQVESEGDEEDDDNLSDSLLVPDVSARVGTA